MDQVEGFFPEREILALRRQQQRPAEPVQPSDSQRKAAWVVLGACFLTPVWVAGWHAGLFKRPGILLAACYLLAGFALIGIVIGLYRALLSGKRPARV